MERQLTTAVVFFIFKRPDQTARVFQAIAEARPPRLYIIADGPRNDDEVLSCHAARQIVETVDWDCDVRKNYSETNLGVRNRIISGLDWVFGQEESAIILEDDCLPHPTFFLFCQELLNFYRNDTEVMHISGDNFLMGKINILQSYYFSKYAHVWGWATWRRAWSLYHKWENDFSEMKLDTRIFQTLSERKFWMKLLNQLRSNQMGYTWDYQWALVCLAHQGLCIMPCSNLVANIGFGVDATHTHKTDWFANLPVVPMDFPLRHPPQKIWDREADKVSARTFFKAKSFAWSDLLRLPKRLQMAVVKRLKRVFLERSHPEAK